MVVGGCRSFLLLVTTHKRHHMISALLSLKLYRVSDSDLRLKSKGISIS